jgi:hypothetical protein
MLKFGLTFCGPHSMGYSTNVGAGSAAYTLTHWIPHFIQRLIVKTFNNTTCYLFGHEPLGPWDVDGMHIDKFCPHCTKKWVD